MANQFRVSADIKYLDGWLAGLTIPAGFTATYPNRSRAQSVARFLARVCQSDDFIRATGTGHRYKVCGHIEVTSELISTPAARA